MPASVSIVASRSGCGPKYPRSRPTTTRFPMSNVRLSLGQTALGRISDIADSMKGAAFQSTSTGDSGSATSQMTASNNLDEVLGLLNSQAGDRYLFSGRAADQPAVDSLDHIMNGDGARAGLKQVIAERNQADLGSNGLGRLAVSAPTVTSVAVAEDAAGSPFGLKLAGVISTLGNATVYGPTGVPPAVSVALTGLPTTEIACSFALRSPTGPAKAST